ncbi:MAG: chemotaxis protein CheA [Planctomycetes bacterium]|nr:chemotaxis protein CheA [Planctomycetota bacterium]
MNEDPIIQAFLEEADERLGELEGDLLKLEQSPSDNEVVNRIFRCAHTLKGNSRMLGFEEIARFTHSLEDLLDQLRKGQRVVTPDVVDTLLASGDVLRNLVSQAAGTAHPNPDVTEGVLHVIHALLGRTGTPPDAPAPAADAGTAAPVAPAKPDLDEGFFGLFEEPQSAVARPADATPATAAPSGVPTRPAGGDAAKSLPTATRAAANTNAGSGPETSSIRVPVDKVDRLINLVGELVITQSIIAQTVESLQGRDLAALEEAVAQMDRHARELHERVMGIRMVPIKTLFARFPRLVRDLAGITNKQVLLELKGEDTELDKTVIERISDPLTHLLRNCVDHGVETPDVREAAGKERVGHVRLEAYQRGGSIFIECADDGKGVDRERVRQKAIQQGLIDPQKQMTEEEVLGLLFKPGLSTATQITEVSGRGVGMDVVKRNVEALGGAILIKSTQGKGTLFQIKLPLTLAIMDGQVLRVGEQIYIVPLVAITESVRPNKGSLHAPAGVAEMVTIRESVLPIVRLYELFDITPTNTDPTQAIVMIVENEGRLAALMVDELLGQQQVVVKNLETNFRRAEGISGATILGDGRVALIVDVPGLIELARNRTPVATY